MPHPLVTILFEWEDWRTHLKEQGIGDVDSIELDEPRTFEQQWYHVPRKGDHVEVNETHSGNVRAVFWKASGEVVRIVLS